MGLLVTLSAGLQSELEISENKLEVSTKKIFVVEHCSFNRAKLRSLDGRVYLKRCPLDDLHIVEHVYNQDMLAFNEGCWEEVGTSKVYREPTKPPPSIEDYAV